ncbi:MAG: PLP-dependent aminotransferase family protein, partial [Planctomycetes bacterium]|nr:PLP-dependent aminotransferase family protein [Planctomycetota bacterium]
KDRSADLDRSNYQSRFSQGVQNLWRDTRELPQITATDSDTVDFASLVPDEKFFPVETFQECFNQAIQREGARLLQYYGTFGYPPLRNYIAERMNLLGMRISADEILMVNGAQQGIDLVLRCFLSPQDKIALSVPTYHNIFPILHIIGAEAVPVRMTLDGPDLEELEIAARDASVRLIYTMPNFQNPTGVTCSLEHRRRLYDLAAKYGLPILEDDFEGDLAFHEEALPPIKALDREGRVIYLNTFSKSLFPGLRIGWLAASGETIQALSALKKATDLENSALLQAAAFEFCRQGFFDRHLKTIRIMIRERMETAFQALEQYMPKGVSWSRPTGGYALWIRLPNKLSSRRVYEAARREGALVSPGTLFSYQGVDPGGLRLSLTRTDPALIEQGIERLSRAISNEMNTIRTTAPPGPDSSQHL